MLRFDTLSVSSAVVPNSVVVSCHGARSGELALRLHFEAEHSNVLIVTAELLNGCLTTCEVAHMEMSLQQVDEKSVRREGGREGRGGEGGKGVDEGEKRGSKVKWREMHARRDLRGEGEQR
jgi:hypothetical protein